MTALDLVDNGKAPSRADVLAQWTRALSVLLFLSSVAALIFQLGWQHALVRRFGGDAGLVTILILALGFGLGCLIGGLLSRLAPMPLLAALAAMNGVCGFVSLTIDDAGDGWTLALAPALASAMLTGAMLPAALEHLMRRTGGVGSAFGDGLFAIMLGAAVACLAGAAVLFPFFGERAALGIAIALNAVVVVGALAINRRERRLRMQADAPLLQRQPLITFAPALALAATAGIMAASYQLFFARAVAYAAAPSKAAFAATLAAFLIGLAAGARRAGRHCALFSAEELMRRAARSAMAANLVGLVALPLLEQFAWLDRAVIVVAMLLCVLVGRAFGALLPYLAEFAITADASAGRRSALLCLAHVAGAAAGALMTGLVLLEQLSLVTIGVVLVIAGTMYTLLLVALVDLPRWQKIVRSMTAVAVAILALALMPRWSANVVERIQWKAAADTELAVDVYRNRS